MNLKRYNSFLNNVSPVNENLDKSKKFLKERELLNIAVSDLKLMSDELSYKFKEGEKKTLSLNDFSSEEQDLIKAKLREIRLTDDQIRSLEKNPEFVKLRELLNDNIGFLYNFVYMYFVEMKPYNEIESLYRDVLELKPLLDQFKDMPDVGRKFDANFIDTSIPNDTEHRTNAEILADGLEHIKSYRKVKKILDTLPPKLKKSYQDAPPMMKEQVAEISEAFDNLPEEMTKEGITKKERIWKNFFGEMKLDTNEFKLDGSSNPNFGKMKYQSRLRRFEDFDNPIREFIKSAKAHLDASLSDGYNERLEKIDKTVDRFGKMGANIVFNEGGIIIVEVFSWPANNFLNSHCSHCIVNYQSYWDSYLGQYNKQYYIYNTNLSSMDDKSTIGVTIRPDRTWGSGACQTIRNSDIGSDFKNILKDWSKDSAIENSLYDYLLPMSKEEVARREKAKIAEREIVKKGISIDKIKEYVREDGANINKDDGRALINAVEEDDLEKTKLVLELGGNPNLKKASDSAISKAKNIDMIKLLVSYGSDITNDVFSNIIHDMEALEFCLRAGLNPNIGNSMPLRKAAKGSWVSPTNLGESYFDAFRMLVKYGASIAKPVDPKNPKLVSNNISSWAAEYSRIDILDYMVELNSVTLADWEAAMTWIAHARKMTDDVRKEVIAYIEKQKEILKQKRS
jgi:hypothetical protein